MNPFNASTRDLIYELPWVDARITELDTMRENRRGKIHDVLINHVGSSANQGVGPRGGEQHETSPR